MMRLLHILLIFLDLFCLVEFAFATSKYLPYFKNPEKTKTLTVPISSYNGQFSVDIFWTSNDEIIIQTPIENVYQDSLRDSVWPIQWFNKKKITWTTISDTIRIRNLSKYFHYNLENSISWEEIIDLSKIKNTMRPYPFVPLDSPVDTLMALRNYIYNHKPAKQFYQQSLIASLTMDTKYQLISQRFAIHYKNIVTQDSSFIIYNQMGRYTDGDEDTGKMPLIISEKTAKNRLINDCGWNLFQISVDVYNTEDEFLNNMSPYCKSKIFGDMLWAFYLPNVETDEGWASTRVYPRISISPDRKFMLIDTILFSMDAQKSTKLGDLIYRGTPNMAFAVSPDWTKIAYIYHAKDKKSGFTAKIVITPLVLPISEK
jgi:hypothetical protein